ncbi:MAG TPA: acetate--CoA ligase family protein, partial [Ktedonobacterales bacterium]|nr:acetate--CoA ligase family protein [Ktedonobacterales bacterium]
GLDGVLCLVDPPRVEPAQPEPLLERYDLLGKVVREARLPVVVLSNTCLDLTPFGRAVAERIGVHFVAGIEHGMRALSNALWWTEARSALQARPFTPDAQPTISLEAPPQGVWSEFQARQLLQSAGVPVVPGALVTDAEAAVAAAQTFAAPVALKIQASAIVHKSDVGGVLLNLRSEEEVRQGFQRLMERMQAQFPALTPDGVLVSPMRPTGTELLVGIVCDQVWGPFLTVGLGGVWTEVLKDTSVRVLPVDREDIYAMLQELRGFPLLTGARGQQPADLAALVEVIFQVSLVAQALRASLVSLELNPLLVSGALVEALDVLITWKD